MENVGTDNGCQIVHCKKRRVKNFMQKEKDE